MSLRSDNGLLARLEQLYTAAVNDSLRELGLLNQNLPTNIMPLRDGMVVAGRAFTIQGCATTEKGDEMEQRLKMLAALTPGSVAVWDTSGDNSAAHWGEIMTVAAMKRGCRGAVVDGGVRDCDKIIKTGFPVFARYRTSSGAFQRWHITGFGVPITIGGVAIHPGDWILGDMDGVIVIPQAIAEEVVARTEATKAREDEIRSAILAGIPPAHVVAEWGDF